jgi:hypothetical protein
MAVACIDGLGALPYTNAFGIGQNQSFINHWRSRMSTMLSEVKKKKFNSKIFWSLLR